MPIVDLYYSVEKVENSQNKFSKSFENTVVMSN